MPKFAVFFLVLSVFFAASFAGINFVKAQNSDTYVIQLQGFVWNRTTLNALIIPADNEPWWNPSYTNIALRAIGQWNDAIAAFSSNYSDYSYLSSLNIQAKVSNISYPGYDIYINWTQSPLSNTSDEVGLSSLSANSEGVIINNTINLASHTHHGDPLSEGDMQNIAIHELGHGLGLGHSNSTADLMYALYTMGSGGESVSTLDAYGVATLFSWMLNTPNFYPISSWLDKSSAILPSQIPYQVLPVSTTNSPPLTIESNPVVQTLVFIFELLIHPEIFTVVIVVIILFVIVALIPSKRKHRHN